MGRKIPGRKHRGIRDPQKQREQRLLSIKDKINAPPSNPDDQEIPKSLARIIDLKNEAKKGAQNRKPKSKETDKFKPILKLPTGTVYNFNSPKSFKDPKDKPAPIFMQEKGESDRHFLYRVNKVCESVIKESQFENKYKVDVQRNPETGEVIKVTKKPKDELEEHIKKLRKEKKAKKKKSKKEAADEPKLTKSQKRRKKLLEKKQKKQTIEDDFNKPNFKDHVKFGEVAHEPPSLTVPRKVENSNYVPRPGQKDLLLKTMLQTNSKKNLKREESEKKDVLRKTNQNVIINKKGKRKALPVALRRQLDKQQKEIINAYRLLKKQKMKK